MNWQIILKEPKVRIGSKITTNLGTDSTPEDNHCLKKVLEYLEKMRMSPSVYNYGKLDEDWITADSSNTKYFLWGTEPFKCGENSSSLCNEKVACVVLKLLERLKSQGSGMFEEDIIDDDEVYFVEIALESTKKIKTTSLRSWFEIEMDDHQDAAFIIVITSLNNDWEYYRITYESHPKNPNNTATGYKDYSEDDYKRMIKVLHEGVFG